MGELVRWLGEQLDRDEAVARGAGGSWHELSGNWVAATVDERSSEAGHRVAMVLSADERAHIVVHDPARVLREIGAMRRLLTLHAITGDELVGDRFTLDGRELPTEYDIVCAVCGPAHGVTAPACATLRLLALPYADQPGFKEEWRP
ncbi:DUF6221 family protein [Streptomyces sp. NPDC049590]|uniref:DUF6221 family protein n=1 Tax=Streptomyces sp. NPDC049590 TaxID=3154834 RepID=UPI00342A11EF